MKNRDFITHVDEHFTKVSERLLNNLGAGEDLTLNLQSEQSLFVRFNANRVRQNTDVEQLAISLKLQCNGRSVEKSRTIGGRLEADTASLTGLLAGCREEARLLPEDINQVATANNGASREEFRGSLPLADKIAQTVAGPAEGSDLAGLYAGGAVIRGNRNSQGQNHWFATETFFVDYSLYNGPKAAKGNFNGARWNENEWCVNLHRTRGQLELLSKPAQKVKPGKYRTYLAPRAFSDLTGMLGWGALSAASWKQGRSAFKKLADGEKRLSPKFNVRENFELGLSPRFNALGEVAPTSISLIEGGEIKNLLVSSRTAKEYGLKANAATDDESPRSLDVDPGSLEEEDVLKELGTGLYLSNLHYLNWSDPVSARITGMTRYACFWVENGEIAGPIKDLRFDESLYDALGSKLIALTKLQEIDPAMDTYGGRALGGCRAPGALIDDFTFTL